HHHQPADPGPHRRGGQRRRQRTGRTSGHNDVHLRRTPHHQPRPYQRPDGRRAADRHYGLRVPARTDHRQHRRHRRDPQYRHGHLHLSHLAHGHGGVRRRRRPLEPGHHDPRRRLHVPQSGHDQDG